MSRSKAFFLALLALFVGGVLVSIAPYYSRSIDTSCSAYVKYCLCCRLSKRMAAFCRLG